MKKITLIAIALTAFSITSCKKDRACKCTYTNSQGNVTTEELTYTKIKKSDAKDACSNYTSTNTSGNNTSTYKQECELK